MATDDKAFSVNKIKDESKFYKIYEEFDKDCTHYGIDSHASCHTDNGNDYFDKNEEEVKNMGYIYLKYWLYDKITKQDFNDSQIQNIFDGWRKYIKDTIQNKPDNPLIFYNLKKDEIKRFQKLYAFNTILYASDDNSKTCENNQCKYMDYFEEALLELINSIKKCSNDSSNNEYCKEFNDFLKLCNVNNTYTSIALHSQYKGSSDETNKKYLLFAEKYNDTPLYIYIKNNKWLNWSKIDHIVNPQKRTTIAATSVVGSAIALSSIFYYFYKYTPFGSSLRKGKGKNIVNIDEGARDLLLYTSEAEQEPFKSRKYNVAYHTFRDT